LDLDHGVLFVERNRTTAGYTVVEGDPKTAAGRRPVALDKHTVQVLRAQRRRQLKQRDRQHAAGRPWVDSGYVFTRPDGAPINPNYATTRFRKLTDRAGLPPVRLHDLRHGAASLAHEAGADLKTLQDLLGHSSIVVTADTYTSVLPQGQRRCADATAALVLAAARQTHRRIKNRERKNARAGGRKQVLPRQAPHAPPGKGSSHLENRRQSIARGAAPSRHPTDTHRPQRLVGMIGSDRVSAAQTSVDVARPKGLEPLTF
jgi:hypothetical protein